MCLVFCGRMHRSFMKGMFEPLFNDIELIEEEICLMAVLIVNM